MHTAHSLISQINHVTYSFLIGLFVFTVPIWSQQTLGLAVQLYTLKLLTFQVHITLSPSQASIMPNQGKILAQIDANVVRSTTAAPIGAAASLKRVENKSAPAKKKERMSSLCKTPPQLIRNTDSNVDFRRGPCLGEGGFARCFLVKNSDGQVFAAKTVAKASLTSQRVHQKLLAEIKIHKCMNHPNIVKFVDCFEDSVNVYMLLEICVNSSLSDLIKARKRLTTPEVRFFTLQLMGAILYMHSRKVVHRDLKLGNIFLDDKMNVKIGDFGLAAVIATNSDRKRTICGTPNYIAPEVLYGKKTGHSFEVDIWSAGIIVYTMLFGKPPFQDKDVEEIYKRIRDNSYTIPEKYVTENSDKFVKDILIPDPTERPSVRQILAHPFFIAGLIPAAVPVTALVESPSFFSLTKAKSQANFVDCLVKARLMSRSHAMDFTQSLYANKAAATSTIAPTIISETNDANPVKVTADDLVVDSKAALPTSLSPAHTKEKYKLELVAADKNEQVSQSAVPAIDMKGDGLKSKRDAATIGGKRDLNQLLAPDEMPATTRFRLQLNVLDRELEKYNTTTGTLVPELPIQPRYPVTFIVRWVDMSNRYGIAYQLSDGVVGVLFKDKATMIADRLEESYMFYRQCTNDAWVGDEVRKRASNSKDLHKRFRVLHTLKNYMDSALKVYDGMASTQSYVDRQTDFLSHYDREDDYVAFRMYQGNFQVNFADHVKIILSQNCAQVDLLDNSGRLHTWTLSEALSFARHAELKKDKSAPAFKLAKRLAICRNYIQRQLDRSLYM